MAKKKIQNYSYTAVNKEGKPISETLTDILGNLLLISSQSKELKGIDQFRLNNKFSKIFISAKATGTIELETKDYNYLKDLILKEIPAPWGINNNIYEIIEKFLKT